MTPIQLDHLKRIDAHLERLLDIASKRTPGEWDVENISPARHDVVKESGGKITSIFRAHDGCHEYREAALPDATFIAACAGNAEAGWRATRVAIAALSKIAEEREPVEHGDCGNGPYVSMFRTSAARFAEQELESILAAFPLETLK